MKSILLGTLLTISPLAMSSDICSPFTDMTEKQFHALSDAYYFGAKHDDMGYTLAAIVWQESFVWKHIIKNNPNDGEFGSYGITHIKLETLQYLEGLDSMWETRSSEYFDRLITNDRYAHQMALLKLSSTKKTFYDKGWKAWWTTYNGNDPAYGEKISKKVRALQQCSAYWK